MKYLIFGGILIALGYLLTQPLGSFLGFPISNPYAEYSHYLYYAGIFFLGYGVAKRDGKS